MDGRHVLAQVEDSAAAQSMLDQEEWEKFTVDEGAIAHFIHAQNGTLSTALRELVMNAIDAKSTTCDIIINRHYFSVRDTGKGFVDEEEIRLKFGHFAQNRDRSESVYARFRIGRGQCMSLAKMRWRSNTFLIETDIKTRGNAYKVTKDLPAEQGCFIEGDLYKKMEDWDLRNLQNELIKMFKFAKITITVNGLPINQEMPSSYWHVDTDEFSIRYEPHREDGIRFYNLGVYVKDLHYHHYGFNADVVTKKPLTLNMARNEIHETDTLFPKIVQLLKAKAVEVAKEKQRRQKLDEVSRRNLIFRLISGDLSFDEIKDFNILRECRGHYLRISSLWTNKTPLTIAPEGMERIADRLSASRIAQVLHPEEARLWQVDDARGLLRLISQCIKDSSSPEKQHENRYYLRGLSNRITAPFIALAAGIDNTHTVSKTSHLSVEQRATLNALIYTSKVMAGRMSARRLDHEGPVGVRKIVPGVSDTAEAWTDGVAMIAINENLLRLPEKGLYGIHYLCHVLLHEYSHMEPNSEGHDHDLGFFERFHNSTLSRPDQNEIMGHCLTSFIARYIKECVKYDLTIHPDLPVGESGRHLLTYQLHFNGKRGLNDFSETLLTKTGFAIKKRGKSWTLRFNGNRNGGSEGKIRIRKWLETLLTEAGLPLLSTREDPSLPVALRHYGRHDSEKLDKIYAWMRQTNKARIEALCRLKGWSTHYRHVLNPLLEKEHFMEFDMPMRYAEQILGIICADESNDAYSFETEYHPYRKRVGGARAVFELDCRDAYDQRSLGDDEVEPGQDKVTLQRRALKQIAKAVISINDPVLRKQFIDTFIPENLAQAMGVDGQNVEDE